MAYNSAYTGPQVDEAVGAVRAKASTWDDKQDKLSGTEDQIVGFNSAGEAVAVAKPTYTAADVGAMPAVSGGTAGQVLTKTEAGQEWQDAPDGLPEGGLEGQVLTKTSTGTQWDDVPSDLPAGGTDGQILTKTADGVAWEDAPEGGVTSFNSRTGAITPQAGDYTADMVGAIPTQTGTQGQVLGFTANNTVGAMDAPSGLPDGGTPGQMLYQGESGAEWQDPPESGITQEEADQRYLQLSGGEMSGNIDMNSSVDTDRFIFLNGENPDRTSRGIKFYLERDGGGIRIQSYHSYIDVKDSEDNGAGYLRIHSDNLWIEGLEDPENDKDAANKRYVDSKSASTSTTITLTTSGWTGSAAPYSQQVSCSIVAADTAVVAVDVDTPGTDADADAEAINAWALCTQQNPTQGAGTLTFYCTEKPTINIPVKVGVS